MRQMLGLLNGNVFDGSVCGGDLSVEGYVFCGSGGLLQLTPSFLRELRRRGKS
jgi:hypothetical protein